MSTLWWHDKLCKTHSHKRWVIKTKNFDYWFDQYVPILSITREKEVYMVLKWSRTDLSPGIRKFWNNRMNVLITFRNKDNSVTKMERRVVSKNTARKIYIAANKMAV